GARDRGDDRGQAAVGNPGHGQGDLGITGQALPGGAGSGADLYPAGKSDRDCRTGGTRLRSQRSEWSSAGSENAVTTHPLSRRIADVLGLQPDAPALEYEGQWVSWGGLGRMADRIGSLVGDGNQHPQIGILLRNRPAQVATLLGVRQCGATVVVINPARGDARAKADANQLGLPMIV